MNAVGSTRSGPATVRLAVHQFAPRLRDIEANARRIADTARATAADVFLTPELSLTGYDVGDDAPVLACTARVGAPLACAREEVTAPLAGAGAGRVVAGAIVDAGRGIPCNAAVVLSDGRVELVYRKLYLPTYGMFDEARVFAPGERLEILDGIADWRFGILVCEDFWHPGLLYVLASAGIDVLLVMAAAPGRGVWEGGENGGRFSSSAIWERMARTAAQQYGIYVALANRVGVEGGVTFAGGSLIVAPDGSVLARADDESECVIEARLSHAELARARRPYAHERDDDARLVARELHRLGVVP